MTKKNNVSGVENVEVKDKEMKKDAEGKDQEKKERKKSTRKSKTARLEEEIQRLREENERLRDQLLRKIAEFDNFRKRTERDVVMRLQNATEELIVELLPVLDDFERSLNHARSDMDFEHFREGVELIYKKFKGILEKQGLKAMETINQPFDPEKHDALMQVEKEGMESGTVVEEHQKGYYLNDRVIRHAQVIVAK